MIGRACRNRGLRARDLLQSSTLDRCALQDIYLVCCGERSMSAIPKAAAAAELLLLARRSAPLDRLPDGLGPVDAAEAYAIQDVVAERLGPVVGWKVGAASIEAEPTAAPLLDGTILPSPASLSSAAYAPLGVEAEIAFTLARDLPAGASRSDAEAAIGAAHVVIEVCASRFSDWHAVDGLSKLADFNTNGALVVGTAFDGWRDLEVSRQKVRLDFNDQTVIEQDGGNTASDLLRLLVWLAGHAEGRGQPLAAGQVVTTGSWTGIRFVTPGTSVKAMFEGLGSAHVDFHLP
ncbi:2-keto-4-pentenoate hydratase [Marinivivus vitaminiproducens]|uniref:2-keto-4-pentenoate hydratase n=1 Tax=Marinivivus vitaminiproducens TaxID=3035935 RepID=UPI00279FB5C3|nr:fumarylacetoacetate hydrolase family protein [Geminicoccaceae bacterium SCSIO 64248]